MNRFLIILSFAGLLLSTLIPARLAAEEPGFLVFASNDSRLISLNFFNNRCVLFQPLMNPAWSHPDAVNFEEILTADIHNLAWLNRKKDPSGAYYFALPGDCRRKKMWVLVPEAHIALGQVLAADVDDSGAHLDSGSGLRLGLPEGAEKRLQKMEQSRKFTTELEQLTWRIMQIENVPGFTMSPVYGLQVHMDHGLVSPVSSLLRDIALDGEMEKAATNGVRKILDLLAMQRLDDQWLVNMISRVPDPDRMSAQVAVPETNASIEIPVAGDPSQLRIVDNLSHVSLNLQDSTILQVRMPRGCSIRARDGSSVVLAKPEKGVVVIPSGTDDICSVITATGRNCNCQSASRQIVELSVTSPEQIRGINEAARPFPGVCLWDSKCTVWATVGANHHCTVKPVSCEAGRTSRLDLPLRTNCILDGAGVMQCDLKDESAGTDECLKLLGDQWKIVFPDISGIPLCQSLPH